MDSKTIALILIVFSTLLVAGCVQNKPIGGERDEYGCLGTAGYTWNEGASACIREWELNDQQVQAAKVAVDHVGYEKNLTIISVAVARCPGCFSVEIEKGKDRISVEIESWVVKGTSLTPDECLELGGRTVNTVGEETCTEDEMNIGAVTGFISPNICCKVISTFDECAEAGNAVMESYPRQCSAGDQTFVEEISGAELGCTSSGGTMRTSLCCKSVGDFPSNCAIGACGCAPDHSHEVKTCDCGEGNCFDGTECVENTFW